MTDGEGCARRAIGQQRRHRQRDGNLIVLLVGFGDVVDRVNDDAVLAGRIARHPKHKGLVGLQAGVHAEVGAVGIHYEQLRGHRAHVLHLDQQAQLGGLYAVDAGLQLDDDIADDQVGQVGGGGRSCSGDRAGCGCGCDLIRWRRQRLASG